jgi:hypothetical protein
VGGVMGTSGSGAGGGSRGSRGGGRGKGAGFITVADGVLTPVDPEQEAAWKALQSVFSQLPPDYISFVLGNEGVCAAYEALHKLHILLIQQKSWERVSKTFGVSSGKKCLPELIDILSAGSGSTAVHPRLQAPLKVALDDFMTDVVGDPVLKAMADGATVLANARPEIFQSTSVRFLGYYLPPLLRSEELVMSRVARQRLGEFALAKANQIVAAFQRRFYGKMWGSIPQVGYSHLFRVIKGELEWTLRQLRRDVVEEPAPVSSAA